MSDIRDQIVTFNLLNQAGYLALTTSAYWDINNYMKITYATESETFTAKEKSRLLTRGIMSSFVIPLRQQVMRQHTDDSGTTKTEVVSNNSYNDVLINLLDGWTLNSNVLSDDQLLRWRDFDPKVTQTDKTTSVTKIYISSFGVSTSVQGFNVESESPTTITVNGKEISGVTANNVQMLAVPPDGNDVAAKHDYHWTITIRFKSATAAEGVMAYPNYTFSGIHKKGSTGYMYSNAVTLDFAGVSYASLVFNYDGWEFISSTCYYETIATT